RLERCRRSARLSPGSPAWPRPPGELPGQMREIRGRERGVYPSGLLPHRTHPQVSIGDLAARMVLVEGITWRAITQWPRHSGCVADTAERSRLSQDAHAWPNAGLQSLRADYKQVANHSEFRDCRRDDDVG